MSRRAKRGASVANMEPVLAGRSTLFHPPCLINGLVIEVPHFIRNDKQVFFRIIPALSEFLSYRSTRNSGSLGFPVEVSRFGGVSVRTHAHTPKSGVPPRQFLVILQEPYCEANCSGLQCLLYFSPG